MSKPNWSEITPEMIAEGDLLYKYLSQVVDETTLQNQFLVNYFHYILAETT